MTGPLRGRKLDNTRATIDDETGKKSVMQTEVAANKTLMSIPKSDLFENNQSSQKGRRSASCGSSPCLSVDVSELNKYSFKSDQASIADWLELNESYWFMATMKASVAFDKNKPSHDRGRRMD